MAGPFAPRIVGLLLVTAGRGWCQTAGAGKTSAAVVLQIRPHVGDTLRMRLDQQSEMTGVRRTSNGDESAMVVNTMKMFSRAIVEAAAGKGAIAGTTVLAVTDSVLLSTTDEHGRAAAQQAEADMRGQRVRFRVAPDGTVGMNETGSGASREVTQVVSLMPAAFPRAAITVGESWIREMPLPSGTQFGAQLSGKLHVTFRFDSLTHGGEWAFVSMRGEMHPAGGPGTTGGAVLEKGLVDGTMLVDQKRGWLTESWFTIVMTSLVTPPLMSGVVSMHIQTRITQHMHTEKR